MTETVNFQTGEIATGQLKAKKLGDSWRINEDDLIQFMADGPTRSPRKRLTARQRQALGRAS